MLSKIKMVFAFFVLAGLVGAGFWLTQTNEHEGGTEFAYSEALYSFNVTDDRELVGIAHNVFVGKVIAQTGTTTDPYLQTQFSVEVLENIKGNLTGTVTVNQKGGYENIEGKQYLIITKDDKLLEPDETYLFVTRVSDFGGHLLVPVYGDLLIKDQTDRQDKMERFKRAFAQEIPSRYDKTIQNEASQEQS